MARKRTPPEETPADPLAWMTPEQRQRHEKYLGDLLLPPTPFGRQSADEFRVLYTERDTGELRIWWPADPEEAREIRAFHDAAHGIGPFTRKVKPGKPIYRSADENALVGTILRDRAERTAYLVYADYLTEHDDPQGDIIRVSVELEQTPPDHPSHAELDARQTELVQAHWEQVYRGLIDMGLPPVTAPFNTPQPWVWLSIERGVIETMVIDRPKILSDHADRLFAAAPLLRKLTFDRWHFDPTELSEVRQLAQIEAVDLSGVATTPPDLSVLFRAKHLTGLKELELGSDALGNAGAEILADWPGVAKLESLAVSGCGLGDESFGRLAHCPALANLRRLRIGPNPASPGALRALLDSPHLANLTDVDLGGLTFDPPAASGLRSAAFAKNLERLSLNSATFREGAFAEFVRCRLPALKWLRLDGVNLGSPAADQLAGAAFAATLEQLYLDGCKLRDAVAGLFARGKFPRLTTLDLSNNRLDRRAAAALSGAAGCLPALTTLNLTRNRLGPDAAAELAGSKLLANVTNLDLSGNRIGPRGAMALARSKHLTKLRTLSVDEAAVGKSGKRALAERFGEERVNFS